VFSGPNSEVFDIVEKINFLKNLRNKPYDLEVTLLKINLKKSQLLIPRDLGDYNIQTSNFLFFGCFLL
jgi:hypothetical protein